MLYILFVIPARMLKHGGERKRMIEEKLYIISAWLWKNQEISSIVR